MKGTEKRSGVDKKRGKQHKPSQETPRKPETPIVNADGPASEDAELFALAKDAVANSGTDVERREKLAALKRRIDNGTYSPQTDAVAEKVLDEHLKNHFGKNSI